MSLRKKRSSGYHYRIAKYILYIMYILLTSLRHAYLLPASLIMLTHISYTEMPKCTSCLKAIMVITRRAQACCIKTIRLYVEYYIYIFFLYIIYIILYYIIYCIMYEMVYLVVFSHARVPREAISRLLVSFFLFV